MEYIDIRDKVSKTLDYLKSEFSSYKFDTLKVNKEDDGNKVVEIYKSYSRLWYINLHKFLYNSKCELISSSHCNTLLIKYYRDTNKLQVYEIKKRLYVGDHERNIYKNEKTHLFTINEKGCFKKTKRGVFRLGYNTINKFGIKHLYEEVTGNSVIDGVYYLPSKLSHLKSAKEINDFIDPNNRLGSLKITALHEKTLLWSTLKKDSYKQLLKYINLSDKDIRYPTATYLIREYYENRYPSLKNKENLINSISGFYSYMIHNKVYKLELPHYKKVKKYIFDIDKKYVTVKNKTCKYNPIVSTKGLKRVVNKVFVPTFKFSYELIPTLEELREFCSSEVYYHLNHCYKGVYFKIYYRGGVILYSLLDRHILTHEGVRDFDHDTVMDLIDNHLNEDVRKELTIKLNNKFKKLCVNYIHPDEELPF